MQDLWGRETNLVPPQQRTAKPVPSTPPSPRRLAALECACYGHSWERVGLSGEKRCTVCGITGYCPGCPPLPPLGAQPFFCTRHTPTALPASVPDEREGGGQP